MQGIRTKDMFVHIQGRITPQILPPCKTRRTRRLGPLMALRFLENQGGFLRKRAWSATICEAQNEIY